MPYGLREGHLTGRNLVPLLPQVEDNAIRFRRSLCNRLRLVFRQVEDLHASRGDLYGVVMIMTMPHDQRHFLPHHILCDEILDSDELGLRVGGLKQQALEDLLRDGLAVMMEWTANGAVFHHVRRLHVNG